MMGLDLTAQSVLVKGRGAGQIAEAAAEMLAPEGADGTFVFIYATDTSLARLRELTAVEDWVGTVGFGVMAGRQAAFDEPAIAVMLTNWPKQHYKLFRGAKTKTI